jgi:glycosyltransferase involved in cell wall biosynthesis
MKKKFGLPFIFDMRGFWADERVDGGIWQLSNPVLRTVYQYFKKKEREFLQESAATISLTHEGKRQIDSWGLPKASPTTVIPCCVDTVLFDPEKISAIDRAKQREALNIPAGHEVVGYVGSVGSWYMIAEMLEFFKTWQRLRPHTTLLFVSNEPESVLRGYADTAGLDWARVRVVQSARKDVPAYLAVMDYGLFFITPVFSKSASSPVKQGELMAMGVPVVCNAGVGDTNDIITRYGAGVLVASFDVAAYREAIETLTTQSFECSHIRAGAQEYFGLNNGIAAYNAVYNDAFATQKSVASKSKQSAHG